MEGWTSNFIANDSTTLFTCKELVLVGIIRMPGESPMAGLVGVIPPSKPEVGARTPGLGAELADAIVLAYSAATMNDRIPIDPTICHGKPVIRGTRTPVSLVVGSLAGGMTFEEVQREYDLTIEDIRAALKFAGGLVDQEQHHPLPT